MLQYIIKVLTKQNNVYKIKIGDTNEKDFFYNNCCNINNFKYVFV